MAQKRLQMADDMEDGLEKYTVIFDFVVYNESLAISN